MHVQLFAKMDPTAVACGCMSTHIMGWHPLPFWPPRNLPAHVQVGKFSLTLGVVILSLYFSRAQLLPLALSFECLSENRASVLLHLTNASCPAQGPVYLLPQIPPERHEPQEIFTGSMRDDGLSSAASSGWQGTQRPYLVGVVELSPCLIKGPQGDLCCYSGRICYEEWLKSLHHHYPAVKLLQSERDKLNK